jgi:hypothetical protein
MDLRPIGNRISADIKYLKDKKVKGETYFNAILIIGKLAPQNTVIDNKVKSALTEDFIYIPHP